MLGFSVYGSPALPFTQGSSKGEEKGVSTSYQVLTLSSSLLYTPWPFTSLKSQYVRTDINWQPLINTQQ